VTECQIYAPIQYFFFHQAHKVDMPPAKQLILSETIPNDIGSLLELTHLALGM